MKTLNLVYPDKSNIKYRIDKFPDGQQQIKIVGYVAENANEWGKDLVNLPVQIKSRLSNFQDLELIICVTKSLRNSGVKEIHLYTPYFLGSRSDRQFEEGSNNYLKDVICPIINSLNFESVTVLDPHSDVLEACLNNFKKESNFDIVKFALQDLYFNHPTKLCSEVVNTECILVSPDAGASKKIYKIAEQIGYKGDIITCSKYRDVDGKLTKTYVPFSTAKTQNKDFIIIDDICDGGATFINIAKSIKNRFEVYDKTNFNSKIYLIVTHGIFSKGFKELSQYFDGIYCTNSYKDISGYEYSEGIIDLKNFLNQLNVF